MAMPEFAPKLQIVAMQSVPPLQVTDPRETRQVLLVTDPIGSEFFQGHLNIVLYYNMARDEDSGWLIAGWMKESLGRAVEEQPILGGPLRRGENGNGDLEIVSNDSGVRLIEAKIVITLQDFLDLKEKEKLEDELVFWKDVDQQNPQFSPLFYVQVTNFQCGGYSIGISCSLFLADILTMDNFLLKWANIHKDILSTNVLKVPPFYAPNLKTTTSPPASTVTSSTPTKNSGQTMLFKITPQNLDLKNNELCKTLALLCIEEAEHKFGSKMSSTEFSLLLKESPKVTKAQKCNTHEIAVKSNNLRCGVTSWSWVDLGIHKVAFWEDNKPVHVSYWIGSIVTGLAMGIPSPNVGASEMSIIVTIPRIKNN